MTESSSNKWIEKPLRSYGENSSISTGQQQSVLGDSNKENRVPKDSDGKGSIVKLMKLRYEQLSNSRPPVNASIPPNVSHAGAIKKKYFVDPSTDNIEEKKVVPRKRVAVFEDDAFAKSRFKVYTDKKLKSVEDSVEKSLGRKFDNGAVEDPVKYFPEPPQNRNLARIRVLSEINGGTAQHRFTPVDVPVGKLVPKKVKVEHRHCLKKAAGKPSYQTGSISRDFPYELPRDDEFINLENEKERSLIPGSMGFRQKNITVMQRKIIVKYLARLNAHSFYPSFILYQTVRIFDAALDAKRISLEELQLTALAAMWIALKKDHIMYTLPTAAKMLSYSDGLYAGRTDLLLKCERDILIALNFEITFPDPYSILCYDISKCNRSAFIDDHHTELAYYCGGYMIDLSLFDEDLMKISVILLAAAAAETALYFVADEVKSGVAPMWFKWRAPHTAKSYSEEEISTVRSKLIQKIEESVHRHNPTEIIFKKYSRSRYGRVAKFLGSKVRLVLTSECSKTFTKE